MLETTRRCDLPVKRGRETMPHGEEVSDNMPTEFSLEGIPYEVDACDEHRQALRDALAPYIAVAARGSSPSGTAVRKTLKGKKGTFTTKDVRKWLQDQGRDVAPSGRLPNELMDEYRAAHSL